MCASGERKLDSRGGQSQDKRIINHYLGRVVAHRDSVEFWGMAVPKCVSTRS